MHPTECMMSFVQTVHVRNSSVGGEGKIISFRDLFVALSDDGRVVLTVNVHVT